MAVFIKPWIWRTNSDQYLRYWFIKNRSHLSFVHSHRTVNITNIVAKSGKIEPQGSLSSWNSSKVIASKFYKWEGVTTTSGSRWSKRPIFNIWITDTGDAECIVTTFRITPLLWIDRSLHWMKPWSEKTNQSMEIFSTVNSDAEISIDNDMLSQNTHSVQ